jgi:oligopeptide/dipeptide ABC transporter ATP-binding protein
MSAIIDIKHLSVHFPIRGGILGRVRNHFIAVDDISFAIPAGRTFGLVGESGSGKSTVARSIIRLIDGISGKIYYQDKNILDLNYSQLRQLRSQIQIVFQDPYASLDPRQKIGDGMIEIILVHQLFKTRRQAREHAKNMIEMVGLNSETVMNSSPRQLSGGLRQRVAVARALLLKPKVVILDEPTSFLDISVQGRLLELLKNLQKKMGLTYLFISHDLNVVGYMSDTIGVMYRGKLVEMSDVEAIFESPQHPYTQLLLSSTLSTDPENIRTPIEEGADGLELNTDGCRFLSRCIKALPICETREHELIDIGNHHYVACNIIGDPE